MSNLLKPTDREEVLRRELLQAKKFAVESIEIGATTLDHLEQQHETLESVEANLDNNEETLIKSMKALRGMTWTGSMYNAYSDMKDRVVGTGVSTAKLIKKPFAGEEEGNAGGSAGTGAEGTSHSDPTYPPPERWIKTEKPVQKTPEDRDLEDISKAVSTLHRIGMTMTEHLDSNDTLLQTIEQKTDKVNEKTLSVTLRASQLTQRARKSGPRYVGRFTFTELQSKCFLAAIDGKVIISSFKDEYAMFDVWQKENNLLGLQCVKTEKFIGITLLGYVGSVANYFGKQEEVHIELDGRETGLLFLSRNWGASGWLRWAAPAKTFEEFFAATKNIPLDETTSELSDREGVVLLKAERIN